MLFTGVTELLQNCPELASDTTGAQLCTKETGEKRSNKWSLGYQFLITGGGHIEAFTPLYM